MRQLNKLECPAILTENANAWLAEQQADPDNETKKTRYRAKDIKERLKKETGAKCVYCESKIGHNTPGDIEHKLPVRHHPMLRFTWDNLTIACTECNRRKGDYADDEIPFLDPYTDDVETMVLHLGPIVTWEVGNVRAEVSICKLNLNSDQRFELIVKKIQKLMELDHLLERFRSSTNPTLRELIRMDILKMSEPLSEFSGMVGAALTANNFFDQ